MGAETSRAEPEKGRNLWGSNTKRAETSGNPHFGSKSDCNTNLFINLSIRSNFQFDCSNHDDILAKILLKAMVTNWWIFFSMDTKFFDLVTLTLKFELLKKN